MYPRLTELIIAARSWASWVSQGLRRTERETWGCSMMKYSSCRSRAVPAIHHDLAVLLHPRREVPVHGEDPAVADHPVGEEEQIAHLAEALGLAQAAARHPFVDPPRGPSRLAIEESSAPRPVSQAAPILSSSQRSPISAATAARLR